MVCPVFTFSKPSIAWILAELKRKHQDWIKKSAKLLFQTEVCCMVNQKTGVRTIPKVDGHFCCPCGQSRTKYAKNLQNHAKRCTFESNRLFFFHRVVIDTCNVIETANLTAEEEEIVQNSDATVISPSITCNFV
jgi:hypothetical protein